MDWFKVGYSGKRQKELITLAINLGSIKIQGPGAKP